MNQLSNWQFRIENINRIVDRVSPREAKFNPYHDGLGRFTDASSAIWQMSKPALSSAHFGASFGHVGEVAGYPQIGKTGWRADNDASFLNAARQYNEKYNYQSGDDGYRSPEFLKAWAMVESGGEESKTAFLRDPFQVNNAGDWTKQKFQATGLVKGEAMTHAKGAVAALEWLRYKQERRDRSGQVDKTYSLREALSRYNGVTRRHKNGQVFKDWYADQVLSLAATVDH